MIGVVVGLKWKSREWSCAWSSIGREQLVYKPDQAFVELGRAWSENLVDIGFDGVDLIGSVNLA